MYKLIKTGVQRLSDMAFIPEAEGNMKRETFIIYENNTGNIKSTGTIDKKYDEKHKKKIYKSV